MSKENKSRVKDFSQKRAEFAFQEVKSACALLNEKGRKEFKSHVKDVPILIRTNGLSAAFAFVFSKTKKGNDYDLIAQISQKWLVDEQKVFLLTGNGNFYEQMCQLDREPYRRSIHEILSLFTWLKRFADGSIKNG